MKTSPITSPPVIFIIFRRPDTTQAVFNVIRKVQPKTLLVIADGPRLEREGEAEQCAQTRAIIDQVDWDCNLLKCYADENMGLGTRVFTGLNWAFEQVENAVILEDDCVPDPSFFPFCFEMLERYRKHEKIMSVSGCLLAKSPTPDSYFFSDYFTCWGWATWRRAWKHFDFDMKFWPQWLEQDRLFQYLGNRRNADLWTKRFNIAYDPNRNDIWSYQFQFASWMNHGLSVRSNVNLVTNIGIGAEGTHTKVKWGTPTPFDYLSSMSFPLQHPHTIHKDIRGNRFIEKYFSSRANPNLLQRFSRKLRLMMSA